MADEAQQTIRNIQWRELFPFTNLFRAFRIAIHPSKLFLGLALILGVYLGGRVLDGLWMARYYPSNGELNFFTDYWWSHVRAPSFAAARDARRHGYAVEYAQRLRDAKLVSGDDQQVMDAAMRGEHFGELESLVITKRNDQIDRSNKDYQDRLKDLNSIPNETDRETRRRELAEQHDAQVRGAEEEALSEIEGLHKIAPQPIFDEFLNYESRQFSNLIQTTLTVNWLNGVLGREGTGDVSFTRGPAMNTRATPDQMRFSQPISVLQSLSNLLVIGPGWMISYHPGYTVLFFAWFLLVWAVFGGAIARIAAVHFARDEKISVRQALRFSFSKVLSFIFAPIIPVLIILVIGVVVAAGGLLLYIPVIGPILVGALFVLALLGGAIMTLVVIATAGGINLMYPTIAVEGSDSFDAISRSFSYVFARPWKMLLYTLIALIYGSITFIFCRYFVYIMLAMTQFFVGWFLHGQSARYWPQIWPPVSDADLSYHIIFPALAWSEKVAAVLIALWVYLVLGLLGGYVLSFYFSANTIIYYLMRREVDATELDDVYLEETEDEFGDAAVTAPRPGEGMATSPAGPAPTTNVVVVKAPPAEPGSSVTNPTPPDEPDNPSP